MENIFSCAGPGPAPSSLCDCCEPGVVVGQHPDCVKALWEVNITFILMILMTFTQTDDDEDNDDDALILTWTVPRPHANYYHHHNDDNHDHLAH